MKMNFFYLFCLLMFFMSCSKSYKVVTESMEPTLKIGDIVKVDSDKNVKINRGDIILYYGKDRNVYCHRCIAIEGDYFNIKECKVLVNSKQLNEFYINKCTNYGFFDEDSIIEGKVPLNSIIVLGDNRDHAVDSRFSGYVSVENVLGKVEKDNSLISKFFFRIGL